jgi:hypothetical protein
MTSISYVDSDMSNNLDMIAHFDERRPHMPTDTGQGYLILHVITLLFNIRKCP